jgi:putative salt-induced outer membrane protein
MQTLLLPLLALSLAAPLLADQVFLNNGDRITGMVQLDADGVKITSAVLGAVKVPRNAVLKITLDRPTALVVSSNRVVTATEIVFNAKDVSLAADGSEAVRAPAAEVRFASTAPVRHNFFLADLLRPWNAAVDAGFTAARGNTALHNLHFGFKAVETADRHRLNIAFSSLLAENLAPTHTTTANKIRSGIRYEYNVTDRVYGFGLATFDSDQLQQLDLRSVLGAGIAFRVAGGPSAVLDLFSGGSFDKESFSIYPTRNSGELLAGEELTYKLSSRTSVSERFVMFPNVTNLGQHRVNIDSSAVLKLTNWLGWQSNLTDMYLSDPPAGTRNSDVLITTGIRFMFGQERTFKPRSKISPLSN